MNRYGAENPRFIERIIAVANYLTFGMAGFVLLILSAIMGGRMSSFLQYHIFQSFFLTMLYFLLGKFLELIAMIFCWIPFLRGLIVKIYFYLNTPFFFGHYSFISGTVALIILYLVLTSIQGQRSYVPWVSDIIKRAVRG